MTPVPTPTPTGAADVSTAANVSDVRVDDEGITAHSDAEVVLDVLFDERRIWSFWLQRDGVLRGGAFHVVWPSALRRFLNGTTRLALVEHVSGSRMYDAEVRLGSGDDRIAVVNDRGLPLGLDKSLRLAQTAMLPRISFGAPGGVSSLPRYSMMTWSESCSIEPELCETIPSASHDDVAGTVRS